MGVPQGSFLCLFVFSLYTNSLGLVISLQDLRLPVLISWYLKAYHLKLKFYKADLIYLLAKNISVLLELLLSITTNTFTDWFCHRTQLIPSHSTRSLISCNCIGFLNIFCVHLLWSPKKSGGSVVKKVMSSNPVPQSYQGWVLKQGP